MEGFLEEATLLSCEQKLASMEEMRWGGVSARALGLGMEERERNDETRGT